MVGSAAIKNRDRKHTYFFFLPNEKIQSGSY